MIGRKRINRKIDLVQQGGEVVDLPPSWQFTVVCPHHGPTAFDFEPFRRNGRDRLAGQMRDAVWSLRHRVVGSTLHSYLTSGMLPFWRFLDDIEAKGIPAFSLADIDATMIRQFLSWMELQVTAKGKRKGQPWSHASRKSSYDRIKTLLLNRQKQAKAETHPDLRFPKNPFPLTNTVTPPREAYSDAELGRIVAAINADLRLLDEQGMEALGPLQVLAVHVLALSVATGRNPQCLMDLKRDSLRPHPLSDREILVTEKRKGYSTHVTAYRKESGDDEPDVIMSTIPRTVGGHFWALCDFTDQLVDDAMPEDRDFILLYRMRQMERKGQVIRLDIKKFNQAAEKFVSRHGLLDDRGQPLSLYLGRLRPTFGSRLYARTRDVRKVQQALGHSDPKTTARHYITLPEEAERNHIFVGQAMVGWATGSDDQKAERLAADGKLPLMDARELLKGGYNTLIARCKNPFRENGAICSKYLPCFTCPQMVVFEEDLWRLYSFYFKLLYERVKMNPNDWMKTYGPVIKIIDVEIAPNFPPSAVMEAKRLAQKNPHPAWPRGGRIMHSARFAFPTLIKALSPLEKTQWPVSVTTAADGSQIVVSRYGDTIWDFWPYVPQENRSDAHKCFSWALDLGNGERLTDPQYAGLLESCKDFLWSLFADPVEGRKRPKMVTIIGLMKDPMPCLVRWMVARGLMKFRLLSELTLDYVPHARQGVSPKTASKRLALLESLYLQTGKIADGLSQHPWAFETAASLSGEASMPDRYKPKTPLIPEAILKRIASIAIDYVERRAQTLLDARDAIEAAGSHRDRIGVQPVRTVAAKEWGFPSARVHSRELVLLKTACYIVIGLFSGIRDSELLSLGVGCISPYMTREGIEAKWLHGTIYKTGYRPKKWLVPPIVETAVKVMERFSEPMRTRLAVEGRSLSDLGSQEPSIIKRLHKVQNQKEKLFLAPDSKRGNLLSVMGGSTAGGLLKRFCRDFDILGDDGKPWSLAPHQFRRAFAYNYAKSEMGDLLYLQEHYGHHSLDMTLLYSDEGTDGYEGDTELLEMIAAAKRERQVEILTGVVDDDAPLAAGGQWIGDWRRTIRTAKNKEEIIEELSGTIALTGTGHSWCAGSAKGTGCGSRCMFEPDMCTECDWAIISQEHLPVWREISKQQEAILACDDIGAPGQALARRVLAKAKLTIAKLEGRAA